jgi:hypothetical protein
MLYKSYSIYLNCKKAKSKAVPLHSMGALGGEEI